jgi:O-methyltransferase
MIIKKILKAPIKKCLAVAGYQVVGLESEQPEVPLESGQSEVIHASAQPEVTPDEMIPGTPLPLWEMDVQFQAIRKLMEGHTLVGVNDSYTIYQFALHVKSLPGDVAEVGVYKGGTAWLLAKAFEATGKDVHLFDTFGGMPPTDSSRDHHKQGDFDDVTYEEVREYLGDCPHAHLYKGFFPDTAVAVEAKTFCLVHVDADIYRSVLDCCQFFYSRLTSGGVMIFDDYGRLSCPGAKAAVDEFFAAKAEHPIYNGHSHSAQAFVIKI